MQRFFVMMMLAVAMIFVVGQPNCAEAKAVYVGTYAEGDRAYLLTETIRKVDVGGGMFTCTVRAANTIYYRFFYEDGGWKYTNSDIRGSHYVYSGASPVAANICNYILRNYR